MYQMSTFVLYFNIFFFFLQNVCLVTKEPGKFDLVYQSADGAETIEYAVSQDKKVPYPFLQSF